MVISVYNIVVVPVFLLLMHFILANPASAVLIEGSSSNANPAPSIVRLSIRTGRSAAVMRRISHISLASVPFVLSVRHEGVSVA